MAPGVMVTVSKSVQMSSGFMSVRSIRFDAAWWAKVTSIGLCKTISNTNTKLYFVFLTQNTRK